LLPLSAAGAAVCREALAALDDPGHRATVLQAGALPRAVLQALCLLDDPEIQAAAANRSLASRPGQATGLGSAGKGGRNARFQGLRSRHPEAMAAILAAMGAPSGLKREDDTVVVHAFAWLIIVTIGVNGRLVHPFADLDLP
jgi:hypothetical protein